MKRGRPPKQKPDQIEAEQSADQPQDAPVRVSIKGGISPDDVSEDDIKAIEQELITARGHWGIIDPRRIVAACVNACGKGAR